MYKSSLSECVLCSCLVSCFHTDRFEHAVRRQLEPVYPVVMDMDMHIVIRLEACDILPLIVLRP